METNLYPNKTFQIILDVWKIQSGLSRIIRWEDWLEKLGEKFLRKQTCTEHTMSIEFAARYIVDLHISLSNEPIDRELILDAIHFHDYGESLKGRDISALKKKDTDDCNEYLAFVSFISKFHKPLFQRYRKAFLLQFCLNNADCFPKEAREIMAELYKNNYKEAFMFQLIENWDYLLYAVEQYQEKENPEILKQVLTRSRPITEKYRKIFPELFETFLDPTTLAWEKEFLK